MSNASLNFMLPGFRTLLTINREDAFYKSADGMKLIEAENRMGNY